jgi:hypothetical protein
MKGKRQIELVKPPEKQPPGLTLYVKIDLKIREGITKPWTGIFRSSDSLMDIGVQIELSAEEEDSDSEVSECTKTASGMFQALDLRVKPFGQGVGDRVSEIG